MNVISTVRDLLLEIEAVPKLDWGTDEISPNISTQRGMKLAILLKRLMVLEAKISAEVFDYVFRHIERWEGEVFSLVTDELILKISYQHQLVPPKHLHVLEIPTINYLNKNLIPRQSIGFQDWIRQYYQPIERADAGRSVGWMRKQNDLQ